MGKAFEWDHGQALAVIGMACRFPGASDIQNFWEVLRAGQETIRFFSDEELDHIDAAIRQKANYVKARGVLDEIADFDASLFGLTPLEAGIADPQQRVMLECAWQALEHAGIHPKRDGSALAVFAGADENNHLALLERDKALADRAGAYQLQIANALKHLAPRLSYLLDLRGPSVSVQTACSTSLVAVHMACQSLLGQESDIALAGGCSIPIPHHEGYLYEPGGTFSPDGHNRSFDASADGTVLGSGCGLVVLKRLDDAIADGHTIHAVILGSAINNDGAGKVGYTAPSVEGQAEVVEMAQAIAGVQPEQVAYIETHGTATNLGDPIEIEALRQVFRDEGECLIGSVKSNIGHANAAAGIAGLIKTVLCLENREWVPSLHFESPNPELQMESSPFQVITGNAPIQEEHPIAGVSSFGIGGTNAHVILTTPPAPAATTPVPGPQLLTLSAKSEQALTQLRTRHLQDLKTGTWDPCRLSDWSYTLNSTRSRLEVRQALVFQDQAHLIEQLEQGTLEVPTEVEPQDPSLVFLFPGQGKRYADLGRALYQQQPEFRRQVDQSCARFKEQTGKDLKAALFAESSSSDGQRLFQPDLWQPAIFVVSHACARMLMAWGVRPDAMIGHSIGEYTAAVIAGVLEHDQALALLAKRGAITAEQPPGSMIAVIAGEEDLAPYIEAPIALAAVNAPGVCILSGPENPINELTQALRNRGKQVVSLETTHAFHSAMMDPVMEPLRILAESIPHGTPQIPYLSNLTGTWIRREDLQDANYWPRHLRQPVRFEQGLSELFKQKGRIFLEVGPGDVLSKLTSRHPYQRPKTAACMQWQDRDAYTSALAAMGWLWRQGKEIDWQSFYQGQTRRKVPAATYPFQRKTFWFADGGTDAQLSQIADPLEQRDAMDQWCYLPGWKSQARLHRPASHPEPGKRWLVLGGPAIAPLVTKLRDDQQEVVLVREGPQFAMQSDDDFVLKPDQAAGYRDLIDLLSASERMPDYIVHGFRMEAAASIDEGIGAGFTSLAHLIQALGNSGYGETVELILLSYGLHSVAGEANGFSDHAALLGLQYVIPKECPNISCRSIDLDSKGYDPGAVSGEILDHQGPDVLALRPSGRWIPVHQSVPLPADPPRYAYPSDQVYVLVNPYQTLGYALIRRLTQKAQARIALVDRAFFPPAGEWETWLKEQGEDNLAARRIRALQPLIEEGARVRTFIADAADAQKLTQAAQEIGAWGPVAGVFLLDAPAPSALIQTKPEGKQDEILKRKIHEATHLVDAFNQAEFLFLHGENPAEGGIGKAEQGAAYHLFAHLAKAARGGPKHLAVEWGPKQWTDESEGEVVAAIDAQLKEKRERYGMSLTECLDLTEILLAGDEPHVVVSTRDFDALMAQQSRFTTAYFQEKMRGDKDKAHERPKLSTDYVAPKDELESLIADIWSTFFEIDKIGLEDDFFELGGHSLLAVQLLSKINETFATSINMIDFFNAPTIGDLVGLIAETRLDDQEAANLEAMLQEIEDLDDHEIEALMRGSD